MHYMIWVETERSSKKEYDSSLRLGLTSQPFLLLLTTFLYYITYTYTQYIYTNLYQTIDLNGIG